MNYRTCPHCHYKFSVKEYLKNPFFKGVYSQWGCVNCGTCLSIDIKRRWLVSFVGIVPLGFAPHIVEYLSGFGIQSETGWAIAVSLLSLWLLFIFSLDRFELPERQKLQKRSGF
ncbi:MAG: hypothetical protein WBL21_11970 [Salinimicrobium sp.]